MKILNFNIGNPSLTRSQIQINWIFSKNIYDVIVLTEVKRSVGCNFIISSLCERGYYVFEEMEDDYGVIIATKYKSGKINFFDSSMSLKSRAVAVNLEIGIKSINIIALYVPSNDKRKNERKRPFLDSVIDSLEKLKPIENLILCGDFNTISRNHIPRYSMFREWDYNFFDSLQKCGFCDSYEVVNSNSQVYSWYGRTGNSYKYDYVLVSENLKNSISNVIYTKDTIVEKLTDHSAVIVDIDI